MDVRRGVVAGLVGLALLAGTTGCSKIGEKVAEEAIERNSNCEDIDIDADEGAVSGSCDGQDFDANASGNAELPADWPSELAVPEGLNISTSNGIGTPVQSLTVVGGIDGDVATVYEGIKAQVTEAGYTIDLDSVTGDTGTLNATGEVWTVSVVVAPDPSGVLDGDISVTYNLTAVGS